MISVSGLSFRYAGSAGLALDGVSLTVPDGGFLGVTGHSGSGKSTLLNAINGVIPHHFTGDYYGSVTVDGRDTVETGIADLSRSVGSVLQDVESQMVASVVEDEIMFGLENFGFGREEAERRLTEALDGVGAADLRERETDSLSGGQKQKVAIASVLALSPGILVLDEPTGELDPVSSREIFKLLRRLNEERGVTVVVAEQKTQLLCEFARELAVMRGGGVVLNGPVRRVLGACGEMRRAGAGVPEFAELAGLLRERGLYYGDAPLNIDEAEIMVRSAAA